MRTMTRDQQMHLSKHIFCVLATALLCWGCDGFSSASVEMNPEVEDMTEVLVINAEIERGKVAWAQISYTEDINALVTTPQKFENKATVTLSVKGGKSEVLRLVTATPAGDAGASFMSASGDGGADKGAADGGSKDTGVDQAAQDSALPDSGKPDAGKGKPDAGKGKPDAGNPYANKGFYVGSTILGEEGKTYTLTVKIGAETYTAKCDMYKEPGISWFAINGMTNRGQYISYSVTSGTDSGKGGKGGTGGYSEEWHVMDPKATRDRYLFEYYLNGVHLVAKDWAIDDNRVVNSTDKISKKEGLKLFNITINPAANQYLDFRVSKIDKPTYDFYNMYEKIVRGLIGVGSVTPYNPKSNFVGKRTVGNFRAVSFSATPGLAPPTPCAVSKAGAVTIQFADSPLDPTDASKKTRYFTKYHLYTDTKTGVDHKSTKISDIKPTLAKDGKQLTHTIKGPPAGASYYRLQVEDKDGFVSPLSPEVGVDTTKDVDGCGSSAAKGSMTCGGVTKKCVTQKTGWCQAEDKQWYSCKDGKWEKYGGGK